MTGAIVIIESPYRAATQAALRRNVAYARAAVRDSIARGELPFASHLYLAATDVLSDEDVDQRAQGIGIGHGFRRHAKLTALYTDLGISAGMDLAHQDAVERGCPIETRSIPGWARGELEREAELPASGRTILEEAHAAVYGPRQDSYGHPAVNHGRTAALWSAFLAGRPDPSAPLTAEEVCWLNILQKVSREQNAPNRDNLVDVSGYAANVAMIQERRG